MSKLVWDQQGEKLYETGVKNCVLYPISNSAYPVGYAWNGVTAVTETPSGAEKTPIYADDNKYLTLMSVEEFGATIEAYTYPAEFAACDGSAELVADSGVVIGQQERTSFGLCYRTTVGNDTDGNAHGYKLHLIYGAMASPSERSYATINDSPEAITFSWELSTTPVAVSGFKPTSLITIDSTEAVASKLAALEATLYGADAFSASKIYAVGDMVTYSSGSSATEKTYKCKTAIQTAGAWDASKWDEVSPAGPRLPLPDEVATMFA